MNAAGHLLAHKEIETYAFGDIDNESIIARLIHYCADTGLNSVLEVNMGRYGQATSEACCRDCGWNVVLERDRWGRVFVVGQEEI